MTYFDFKDPDNPLKEQEMWPFVQGELGKDAILEWPCPNQRGMPGLGKMLHARRKTPRRLPCEVRIGPIEKTLYVFGDRTGKKRPEGYR